MRLALFVAAACTIWITESAWACKPIPGIKRPTVEQLINFSAAGLKGIPEEIDVENSRNGVVRVRQIEWIKGEGPSELIVAGFPNLRGIRTSCGFGPNSVTFGMPHLMLLERPPKNGTAALLQARETDLGKIYRVVFPAYVRLEEDLY